MDRYSDFPVSKFSFEPHNGLIRRALDNCENDTEVPRFCGTLVGYGWCYAEAVAAASADSLTRPESVAIRASC